MMSNNSQSSSSHVDGWTTVTHGRNNRKRGFSANENEEKNDSSKKPRPAALERRREISLDNVQNGRMKQACKLVQVCHKHDLYEKNFEPLIRTLENPKLNWGEWRDTTTKTVKSLNAVPRLLGLDCEMVLCASMSTKAGDHKRGASTLARASLVECKLAENGDGFEFHVLLDEYVTVPDDHVVVDYLTHVSGIEKQHLDEAVLTSTEVRQRVFDLVQPCDVIVGHSIHADFEALRFWHGNFVDTSFLCSVKDMPSITLSLKDVASEILQEKSEADEFQKTGESHDSVADAEWAIRVMLKIIKLSNEKLPMVFDALPRRYKSRLTFHWLQVTTTEEHIKETLRKALQQDDIDKQIKSIRPIRWHVRKDGVTNGSSVIEFEDPETAERVFKHLIPADTGCGGYANTGPCCASGYPDRLGMQRKLIKIIYDGGKTDPKRSCEVICYHPVQLSHTKKMSIKAGVMGRVIGRHGRTLVMLQQVNGVRASITRQSVDGKPGELEIAADSWEKLKSALSMLHDIFKKKLILKDL